MADSRKGGKETQFAERQFQKVSQTDTYKVESSATYATKKFTKRRCSSPRRETPGVQKVAGLGKIIAPAPNLFRIFLLYSIFPQATDYQAVRCLPQNDSPKTNKCKKSSSATTAVSQTNNTISSSSNTNTEEATAASPATTTPKK